jgi:hypothetical protein
MVDIVEGTWLTESMPARRALRGEMADIMEDTA